VDRLKAALADIDREIAEEARSANEQVRLIAGLPPGSRERDAAVVLLADLNRSLETWQRDRERLMGQILMTTQATSNGIETREEVRQRLLTDSRRWRQKAEELRTVASGTKTPSANQAFERLATNYELLADHAETRAVRARKKGASG
jgi:hypothetical protein